MKKLLLSAAAACTLFGADHALYTHSVELTGGLSTASSKTHLDNGWVLGFRYNYNRNTLSNIDIAALQLAIDYSGSTDYDTGGSTSVTRLGANALWYLDNDSEWTPFALLGVGVQFFGTQKHGNSDGLFVALGGGVEYQLRGDFALFAEGKWLYAGESRNHLITNVGLRYSFGN